MAEVNLNFLLIGKTGEGKSATGNTMLGRKAFKTSSSTSSETKDVTSYYAEFNNYTLLVVDGPGLQDTDMDKVQDKIAAAKNMDQALAMCNGGVDAFLLVTKFGERFTKEDRDALEALKRIFGDGFMRHVIVVVTCGDQFQGAMEEEKRNISFHDWCKRQKGEFLNLYQDCEKRFLLFYNWETDEEKQRSQIQEVVQLADDLQKRHGRYISQSFKDAYNEREKLILEEKAPQLKEEIQKRICFLVAEIEDMPERPSEEDKKKIRSRVQELMREIDESDKGFGVLKGLKDMAKQVEAFLNDKEKLLALVKKLENIRIAKRIWGFLGSVVSICSTLITPLHPIAGRAAGLVSGTLIGAGTSIMVFIEKNTEKEKEEIKKKIGKTFSTSKRDGTIKEC